MFSMLARAKDLFMSEGTEGRNPFEVWALAWSAFVGASQVFGSPAPGSVQELLPSWLVTTWYTLLCIGGLVGLVGVWLRNLILSLLVERAAMLVVGPSALIYSVAIFVVAGYTRGMYLGGAILVFAIGPIWRAYRIQTYIHKLRSSLSEAEEQ